MKTLLIVMLTAVLAGCASSGSSSSIGPMRRPTAEDKARLERAEAQREEGLQKKYRPELMFEAEARKERRDTYLANHLNRPEQIGLWISEGKIGLGMTAPDVEASWGKPDRKNISAGNYGRREQWLYGRTGGTYVYLENGKVTSWTFTERLD